jgi:hypothetical protein
MSEGPVADAADWVRDHAASGWRSRAWLDKGEVVAYDDGRWYVSLSGQASASAEGVERDAGRAKRLALLVYEALTT